MTQDNRWMAKYNEVMDFMKQNHRNPSRHRLEEHDMLNWVKANGKKMNARVMKENRMKSFKKLMEIGKMYMRKNQYH